MTRKRFVKLLMSKGYSRNEAQQKAVHFNSRHIPYKRAYSLYRFKGFTKNIIEAMSKIATASVVATTSLKEFAERYKEYEQRGF